MLQKSLARTILSYIDALLNSFTVIVDSRTIRYSISTLCLSDAPNSI